MSKGKILFKLSGSIACYKACYLISRLVQAGYDVQTVATKAALEFVGAATLEGLSGRPVETETFVPGRYMQHIHLAKWADLTILCPATANTINKLANGVGDDLVSTLFLAHNFSKPYLVAPAMNTKMYQHPATRQSVARLREYGVQILETASGVLACGDVGEGRLLEPELLVQEIEKAMDKSMNHAAQMSNLALSAKKISSETPDMRINNWSRNAKLDGLKVLITSGGTREAIDGVRSITNFSTGKTGAVLADYFMAQGHRVTLVHAETSELPFTKGIHLKKFVSFADLQSLLKSVLKQNDFDVVLHLAAVSDYSVDSIESSGKRLNVRSSGKIDSSGSLTLRLKKNEKLVDQIKFYGDKEPLLVAFKLTNGASEKKQLEAVRSLLEHSHADFIVQNDLTQVNQSEHLTKIYAGEKLAEQCRTKQELAVALEKLLVERVTKFRQMPKVKKATKSFSKTAKRGKETRP